jgi:hypothetical protein
VQCVDITERLLVDGLGSDPELESHVAGCERCSRIVHGLERVDVVLTSTLVVAPPLELQRQLAQMALDAARPEPAPWWRRLGQINFADWLAQRPQTIAAQGLAAVMLALASWQIFGWVTAFQPVVGDVGYAMELVAGSPAVAYLGGLQIDLQSLGLWSLVGLGGWLISENGLIGRRLSSSLLRLP